MNESLEYAITFDNYVPTKEEYKQMAFELFTLKKSIRKLIK